MTRLASSHAAVPWFAAVLVHHVAIEQAFACVRAATDAWDRRAAQRWLSTSMTGHAIAEEVVICPALGFAERKMHALLAYMEQSGARSDLAALETLAPMSRDARRHPFMRVHAFGRAMHADCR